jgi:protein-tyrosine phosphatase
MRAELFEIRWNGNGRMSTMARPRGGDWLDDEMAALRRSGVDVVVSLLEPFEIMQLDLLGERAAAERAGIALIELPITDRQVPSRSGFLALLDVVESHLDKGKHVVAHCRMGIGRSSMVVAGVLLRSGMSPNEAWTAISSARWLLVPDTEEQRRWVETTTAS